MTYEAEQALRRIHEMLCGMVIDANTCVGYAGKIRGGDGPDFTAKMTTLTHSLDNLACNIAEFLPIRDPQNE